MISLPLAPSSLYNLLHPSSLVPPFSFFFPLPLCSLFPDSWSFFLPPFSLLLGPWPLLLPLYSCTPSTRECSIHRSERLSYP